jgi:hypothetical protein
VAGFSEAFSQTIDAALHGRLSRWQAAVGFADNVHEDVERRSCAVDLDGKVELLAYPALHGRISSAPVWQIYRPTCRLNIEAVISID